MSKKVHTIDINMNWCKACGICMEFCPQKVFDKDREGKPVIIDLAACTGCRICETRCPDYAIAVGGTEVVS